MARHEFKTEVNELLNLIIHSLYSNKEIFLRELVSNASDALDKLKYLTLTDEAYKRLDFEPRIDISFDEKEHATLAVADSGIGMNDEDLATQLGTIARSGTRHFLGELTGDRRKDANLIGQFGVGFYSCFMVADEVEVISKKAGEERAWRWVSDGRGSFEISEAERDTFGTTVLLHLDDEGREFATRWRIEKLIGKYSNHIPFPIYLEYTADEGQGEEREEKREVEQINAASALWLRPKSELSDEEYAEFYKTLGHDVEDPLLWVHTQAEGALGYTTLFYVPGTAPVDMYRADYTPGVKLYVRRVFVTDDARELMPSYLRFVRGVIDSEDLPLNVSRETLQQNRVMASIRSASVKKLLKEFKELSERDAEKYARFVEQYNRPLKEGVYSDFSNRDALLDLVRFKSTAVEGWTGLADYRERMPDDQKAIYYITGGDEEILRGSPLLEAYRNKQIEVLVMDDEIDELAVSAVGEYKGLELKAINRSGAADELETDEDEQREKELEPVIEKIGAALGERVKQVKASARLSDSPSCIVLDENDPTLQMRQVLEAMGQKGLPDFKPILEVNPGHPIVESLSGVDDEELVEDASFLLLEQALLVEGAAIDKPADFAARLNRVLKRALR
ncbi:MAG: molecular chaperone HtpG [Polyangia bacterium]